MTKDIQDAIVALKDASLRLVVDMRMGEVDKLYAWQRLEHAIRHLAYPDRDYYPKTRRATKGAPIVRK